MKILFILSTVLLVVAGCTFNNEPIVYDTETIVFEDITDPLALSPDVSYLVAHCNLAKTIWQGYKLTTGTISESAYTAETTFNLEPENALYGNKHVRQSKVDAFLKAVKETIDTLHGGDTLSKKRSAVFTKMVTALTVLSRSKSPGRHLVVYSNLMHNEDDISFYSPETLSQLKTHPEQITRQLLQNETLPNLKGITIHFLFSAKDYTEAQQYAIVSSYFKALFEQQGAVVNISAGKQQQNF